MAQILVDKIEKIEKNISVQKAVRATYSISNETKLFQLETYSGPGVGHVTQTIQFDEENLGKLLKLISSEYESFTIPLLDNDGNVKYGINWGNRAGRNINQAYLDLPKEIYNSSFFPTNGIRFDIRTDDNQNITFTRAQKDNVNGHALQTPDDNTTIGIYLRNRLSLQPGEIITKEAIEKYGRNYITISKIGSFYYLDFSQKTNDNDFLSNPVEISTVRENCKNLLPSIRTKPFLLLAGISGTGKSRIVKQMAFDTCPNIDDLQKDKTSPGNYQLIEVKPNWHDSTEVLGYESEIGGSHYVVTPFVKFLVKAMLYEDKVPFFVCMDEMNLAPVEQYFAEFLSVLESRKLIDGHITSEALIKAEIFQNYEDKLKAELCDQKKEKKEGNEMPILTEVEKEYRNKFDILYDRLKKEGLRIPSNLIVVGTVNMDETTHQFSRKVIDRAMTIEMNIADGSKPFADFFDNDADLKYRDEPLDKDLFVSKVVQAKEALELLAKENAEDVAYLKANIPALLSNLNEALNGTPFKIAYRVQNELVIYFFELRRENKETKPEDLLGQAMDAILMQKVLPRVEGDEDLLEKPLEKLHTFTQNYENAHAKVEEMQTRLNAHFTSFWP